MPIISTTVGRFLYLFFFISVHVYFFLLLFVVDFVIHWNETAKGLHVFPIPIRRNGVVLIVNKRVWNAVLGCNLRNDRMISAPFQGKSNITIIQVYATTTSAEEAEVEWFYEDLQEFLELNQKKKKGCPSHHRGLEYKSRKSRDTWRNRQVWLFEMKQGEG